MENPASRPWWRRNLNLIIGVSLPALLVLVFGLAMLVPRLTVDDPRYDLLLASRHNPDGVWLDGRLDFEVREGELLARFRAPRDTRGPDSRPAFTAPLPRLYYFSTATASLRELSYSVPEERADGALLTLGVLSGRELSDESVAPDGYRFDNSYRGSRGFLFLFDGYRYNARIEKGGRSIKIPSIGGGFVGGHEFVAWVEKE